MQIFNLEGIRKIYVKTYYIKSQSCLGENFLKSQIMETNSHVIGSETDDLVRELEKLSEKFEMSAFLKSEKHPERHDETKKNFPVKLKNKTPASLDGDDSAAKKVKAYAYTQKLEDYSKFEGVTKTAIKIELLINIKMVLKKD